MTEQREGRNQSLDIPGLSWVETTAVNAPSWGLCDQNVPWVRASCSVVRMSHDQRKGDLRRWGLVLLTIATSQMSLKRRVRNWCVMWPMILWIMSLGRPKWAGLSWASSPTCTQTWSLPRLPEGSPGLHIQAACSADRRLMLAARCQLRGCCQPCQLLGLLTWLLASPWAASQGSPGEAPWLDQEFAQYHCLSRCCWKQPGLTRPEEWPQEASS